MLIDKSSIESNRVVQAVSPSSQSSGFNFADLKGAMDSFKDIINTIKEIRGGVDSISKGVQGATDRRAELVHVEPPKVQSDWIEREGRQAEPTQKESTPIKPIQKEIIENVEVKEMIYKAVIKTDMLVDGFKLFLESSLNVENPMFKMVADLKVSELLENFKEQIFNEVPNKLADYMSKNVNDFVEVVAIDKKEESSESDEQDSSKSSE